MLATDARGERLARSAFDRSEARARTDILAWLERSGRSADFALLLPDRVPKLGDLAAYTLVRGARYREHPAKLVKSLTGVAVGFDQFVMCKVDRGRTARFYTHLTIDPGPGNIPPVHETSRRLGCELHRLRVDSGTAYGECQALLVTRHRIAAPAHSTNRLELIFYSGVPLSRQNYKEIIRWLRERGSAVGSYLYQLDRHSSIKHRVRISASVAYNNTSYSAGNSGQPRQARLGDPAETLADILHEATARVGRTARANATRLYTGYAADDCWQF